MLDEDIKKLVHEYLKKNLTVEIKPHQDNRCANILIKVSLNKEVIAKADCNIYF